MSVMRTQEEEDDRNAHEKLLGGCVLISVVDLLPHIEIVICPRVELEWYSTNPVEHEERPKHVGDVCERP